MKIAPSNKKPDRAVTQIICIGVDDCQLNDGLEWLLSILPCSTFFLNGKHHNGSILRTGCFEVANHTYSHPHCGCYNTEQWNTEISINTKAFGSSVIGFRAPYLEYNDDLFTVLNQKHYSYDSSIEDGWSNLYDGTNYLWPYTLDYGSPGAVSSGISIMAHPSLLEIPVYPFIDLTGNKITGTDWNVLIERNISAYDFWKILINTLDLRELGNRCPLTITLHSDLYSSSQPDYLDRRQAVKCFIQEAAQRECLFLTYEDLYLYMKEHRQ